MFNVATKGNRFIKTARPFEELGHLFSNDLSPFIDNNVLVEIAAIINPVLYRPSFLVLESFRRSPSFRVNVERYPDNTIRREEAVVDALLQRITVNGIPEVFGVACDVGFFRSRC